MGPLTRAALIACALVASAAAETLGPEEALSQRIAVWRFDALGIDGELVARLETLFRMELDRLVKTALPSRRDVDREITGELRECGGDDKCLTAIGKRLGVDVVITGTVGSLGNTFVLNIRAVDVAQGRQLRQIATEPLRGGPDELIESVREAAYRLLAPDQLLGAIQIQTDVVAAEVRLGERVLGKTPLANLGVVGKLPLGKHVLRVSAPGHAPFEEEVTVRFQKISPVVVRLIATEGQVSGPPVVVRRRPFYAKTWFLISAGVAAVALGASIGYLAGQVPCTALGGGGC
jgi:hypothetical protein